MIDDYWNSRNKYFLIITVPQPSEAGFQPIDWVDKDGDRVEQLLRTLNYKPLHDRIHGQDGNFNEVTTAIDLIHKGLNDKAIVVVYFSGHGKPGEESEDFDLILNNADIELSRLIRKARGGNTPADPSYKGKLILVIDACDSGYGISHTLLKSENFSYPTVILTSSSVDQKSVKLKSMDESAFTSTFEDAATVRWQNADANHDGILEYEEIQQFSELRLRNLLADGEISHEMKPIVQPAQHYFLAYKKDQDLHPDNPIHLNLLADEILTETVSVAATQLSLSREGRPRAPVVPPEAKEIAGLISRSDGLSVMAQGYKALAEGDFEKARKRFEEAQLTSEDPGAFEKAEVALARTELFSDHYGNAADHYLAVAAGSNDSDLIAETGVSLTLSNRPLEGGEYLSRAFELQKKSGTQTSSAFLSIVTLGLRERRAAPTGDIQPMLNITIPQSLAVAYSLVGSSDSASEALAYSDRAAAKLEGSTSAQEVRTVAQSYVTQAEISIMNEDRRAGSQRYERAIELFEKSGDRGSAYASALMGYEATLKGKKNSSALANVEKKLEQKLNY